MAANRPVSASVAPIDAEPSENVKLSNEGDSKLRLTKVADHTILETGPKVRAHALPIFLISYLSISFY